MIHSGNEGRRGVQEQKILTFFISLNEPIGNMATKAS